MIERAQPGDLADVRRLLEQSELPLVGVDEHVQTMFVAKEEGRVVGTAGLELYQDGALLRSVAVESRRRGEKLGHQLTQAALDLAKNSGAATVFLLTTTAEHFFPKLGFAQITRDEVPASVRESVEFRVACPSSAVVMRKQLR